MKIITIDGYSGCGKSSLAKLLAHHYKLPWLDSGSIYRALALISIESNLNNVDDLIFEFKKYSISFNSNGHILLNNNNVNNKIRKPEIAEKASQLAKIQIVRKNLLNLQRAQVSSTGLIADGRDMGSIVFPYANFKFFLTADIEKRADRRYKELQLIGKTVSIAELMQSIELRDNRDSQRSHAPLVAAAEAIILDTSNMNLNQVFKYCINHIDSNN